MSPHHVDRGQTIKSTCSSPYHTIARNFGPLECKPEVLWCSRVDTKCHPRSAHSVAALCMQQENQRHSSAWWTCWKDVCGTGGLGQFLAQIQLRLELNTCQNTHTHSHTYSIGNDKLVRYRYGIVGFNIQIDTLCRSFWRQFYESDHPTNSVTALKNNG